MNPETSAANDEAPKFLAKIAVVAAMMILRRMNSRDHAIKKGNSEKSQCNGKNTADCGIAWYGAPMKARKSHNGTFPMRSSEFSVRRHG